MTSRSHIPADGQYGSVPIPNETHMTRGYGSANTSQANIANPTSTGVSDFAQGHPSGASPLSQSYNQGGGGALRSDEYADAQRDISASTADGPQTRNRATSDASTAVLTNVAPSRSGTLKKKSSVSRKSSLRRSNSRKSMNAGTSKGVGFANDGAEYNSALYTPIPTTGTPTDILADRFQGTHAIENCTLAQLPTPTDHLQHGVLCSNPSSRTSARSSRATTIAPRPS